MNPNHPKDKFHNAYAIIDDPVSSFLLHMQYLSTKVIPFFMRLSQVKIIPQVVVHTKNTTLLGALEQKMLFQGNYAKQSKHLCLTRPHKGAYQTYHCHLTSTSNDQALFLQDTRVQHIQQQINQLQFPIVEISNDSHLMWV